MVTKKGVFLPKNVYHPIPSVNRPTLVASFRWLQACCYSHRLCLVVPPPPSPRGRLTGRWKRTTMAQHSWLNCIYYIIHGCYVIYEKAIAFRSLALCCGCHPWRGVRDYREGSEKTTTRQVCFSCATGEAVFFRQTELLGYIHGKCAWAVSAAVCDDSRRYYNGL